MLWILKWNMSRDFSTEKPGFVSTSQEEEEEEEYNMIKSPPLVTDWSFKMYISHI